MKQDKKEKYLPFLIFAITILLGLTSVFLSYRAQRLKITLPEIFQQAGYPEESPGGGGGGGGGGDCDPACMSGGSCDWDCDWYKDRCREGAPDPWCCDDDDDDDDDETPPPPPTENFNCVSLGPSPGTPQPGTSVTLTCRANVNNLTLNHYNFTITNAQGAQIAQEQVNSNAWEVNYTYTVPASGSPLTARCDVCVSSDNSNCKTANECQLSFELAPLSFVCADLTRNPTAGLQIGDTVNFTCSHQTQNVTFHHYNYRIHRPSDPSDTSSPNYWYTPTEWQNLGSSTPTYTIPENGDYIVQCQACATTGSSQCTTWGQATGWTQ